MCGSLVTVLKEIQTGAQKHIFEGAGDKWQDPTGHGSEGQWQSLLQLLLVHPYIARKALSEYSIKMYLFLDKIGYPLYEIIH